MTYEQIQPWLPWIRTICACCCCYYVIKDSRKNEVPYRNFWIIFSFVCFPLTGAYIYYKGYIKRKGQVSELTNRQLEMEMKQREMQTKLRIERNAWEEARKKEWKLNSEAQAKLEKEIEAERKKRAAAHKKRMKELAEERELQQEAAAKALHLK